MKNLYAECCRCGEKVEGDRYESRLIFEAVQFRQISTNGAPPAMIDRDDDGDSMAFGESYPLCPDCMKDALEFVQGEYQPPKQESESPLCPVCNEPLEAVGTISYEGEDIPCNCVYVCPKCGRDRMEGES